MVENCVDPDTVAAEKRVTSGSSHCRELRGPRSSRGRGRDVIVPAAVMASITSAVEFVYQSVRCMFQGLGVGIEPSISTSRASSTWWWWCVRFCSDASTDERYWCSENRNRGKKKKKPKNFDYQKHVRAETKININDYTDYINEQTTRN